MVAVATYRKARRADVCRCRAYAFPHRLGSGRCVGLDDGPFCGSCGMPCRALRVDNGIGSYEYWGCCGVDTRIEIESDCCGSACFSDAELKINCEDDDV